MKHNRTSEEKILSIMINNSDKASAGIAILNQKCFTTIDNRNIFSAIYKVENNNDQVDVISVVHALKSMSLYDNHIKAKIENLSDLDINASLFSSLAKEIIDVWKVNETTKMIDKINDAIQGETSYANIRSIMNQYSHLDMTSSEDMPENILSIIEKSIKQHEDIISGKLDNVEGLKFGFKKLDSVISLRPGNTYCIAARPAMGKTSFALNIIDNLIKKGLRIYFISTEMQKEEIMEKFITMKQGISNEDFRKLSPERKLARYKEIYAYIASHKSELIIDCSVYQLHDSVYRARSLHKEKELGIMVVDYIQQMEIENNTNRVQVVSEISRKYKQLSMELKIPSIFLSQLSRKCEDRSNKRPILSDLRESGALEQDASAVIFLYRPAYYGETEDQNGNDISDLTEIIIAKNRYGNIGIIKAKFDTETTTFSEVRKNG